MWQPAEVEFCYCGLIKQAKAGTTVIDGVETCNNCGLPVNAPTSVVAVPAIPGKMVTTLEHIPGYTIVEIYGVVADLSANAGWTATTKGNIALGAAMENLRRAARQLSANAIVGVQASTFGAGGGITNALGGDAVGVLILGTAVKVEPNDVRAPVADDG